jgi:N-succinyl-L-ornithine transcarbamylase
MESALRHPLQGLTDAITIQETKTKNDPRWSLLGATRALPHAVANSFVESMQRMDVELIITNPGVTI